MPSSFVFVVRLVLFLASSTFPQQQPAPDEREVSLFVERAHATATTGSLVETPAEISANLRRIARDEDYALCDPEDSNALKTYRIEPAISARSVAVKGGNACFCAVVGNCAFWIYKRHGKKYAPILETDLVQTFGFLPSRSHGYPDLVAWSHGSAFELGGRLFRFNGEEYVLSGSWDEDYEYLDEKGEMVRPEKPRITSHFTAKDAVPQ
jgi:hypothetical protein